MKKTYCCDSCAKGLPCEGAAFKPSSCNNYHHNQAYCGFQIDPASGLYVNAAGQLSIDPAILGALAGWPVGPTPNVPVNYTWTVSPSRISSGGLVTINVSGLHPNGLFTVRIVPLVGQEQYVPLKADADGNITNAKVRLSDPNAQVVFTPIYAQGIPNVSQYAIEVLPCGVTEECTCNGTVSVKPYVSSNNVVSGQSFTLTLIVTNTNSCPAVDFELPALVLPPNFSGATVSIPATVIPGRGSRTFQYNLQAQNTSGSTQNVSIVVPSSSATYKCSGTEYAAGGGAVSLSVGPASGAYCGLAITEFSFDPTTATEDDDVEVTITVKNVGTSPLTNVTMPLLALDGPGVEIVSGIGAAGSIAFSGINLAAGATHTETVVTRLRAITAPFSHTLTIPAGYIYGTCNSSLITNLAQAQATINLVAP